MKHNSRVATVALAGLLLAGCSGTPATTAASAPAGTNRPAAAPTAASSVDIPSATPAPTTPTTPTPADDGTADFGTAYTWADGLSITVGAPKPYKPNQYAAGVEKGKDAVVLSVTLVNNTGRPFDPAMVSVTAQSGNEEATQIFDSGNGVEGSPSTKVLNGREVAFKVAFSVADRDDVVLEVRADWEHDSVLFSS